jgi:hypothetical protein
MARHTRGAQFYFAKALETGGFNDINVARILAALSVDDLRAMFWDLTEMCVAFGCGKQALRTMIKAVGAEPMKIGGKFYIAKLPFLELVSPALNTEDRLGIQA